MNYFYTKIECLRGCGLAKMLWGYVGQYLDIIPIWIKFFLFIIPIILIILRILQKNFFLDKPVLDKIRQLQQVFLRYLLLFILLLILWNIPLILLYNNFFIFYLYLFDSYFNLILYIIFFPAILWLTYKTPEIKWQFSMSKINLINTILKKVREVFKWLVQTNSFLFIGKFLFVLVALSLFLLWVTMPFLNQPFSLYYKLFIFSLAIVLPMLHILFVIGQPPTPLKKRHVITDIPLKEGEENLDCFGFNEGIVNRIYEFLGNNGQISPLTIAVTGEWGSGKSSAINLLKGKIKREWGKDKKEHALVLSFEPLLEGRLELPQLIELFYTQLYRLIYDSDLKKQIKNIIKSIQLSINLPLVNFTTDIKNLVQPQIAEFYTDLTSTLNKTLQGKSFRLFVFIDEVDRLPPQKIIEFLLFTRIIETFDNLVCIVGIDYACVLKKMFEGKLPEFPGYDSAKGYLDKLFQCQFGVYIEDDNKQEYTLGELGKIHGTYPLRPINGDECGKITKYLSTPRRIKKWLILNIRECKLIEDIKKLGNEQDSPSTDLIIFLGFLAVITKNPIVYENFCKHTIEIIKNDTYSYDAATNSRLLISLGIIVEKSEKQPSEHIEQLSPESSAEAKPFAEAFLKSFGYDKKHIAISLAKGYSSAEEGSAYSDFCVGDINKTLDLLSGSGEFANTLASDIARDLEKIKNFMPATKPDIKLLNKLWRMNSYSRNKIVFSCLESGLSKIENIITEADLSLSLEIIIKIIHILCPKFIDERGKESYDIDNLKWDESRQKEIENNIITKNLLPEGIGDADSLKQKLKAILESWIDEVKDTITNNKNNWSHSVLDESSKFILHDWGSHIFTCFVVFARTCKVDNGNNEETLAILLIEKFLGNPKVPREDKKIIIEIFHIFYSYFEKHTEKDTFARWSDVYIRMLHGLNDENELRNYILNIAEDAGIKHDIIDAFKKREHLPAYLKTSTT